MKKIYIAFIPLLLLLGACKKDHPDPFNSQLTGDTWELYEVDTRGGIYMNPPFTNGYFTFKPNGRLQYLDMNGTAYGGTWNIYHHEDDDTHSLYISVLNLNNYDTVTEFFDDIKFTDNNHFTAFFQATSIDETFKFYFQR